MKTKVCTKCGAEKTADCFNREKLGKLGLRAICRTCQRAAWHAWKQAA